jgi:hypothetical protein
MRLKAEGEFLKRSLYLVSSLRLLEARCNSIEEMELVNTLCRLAEYAERKVI